MRGNVEVHGVNELVIGLEGINVQLQQAIKNAIEDASDAATEAMLASVPRSQRHDDEDSGVALAESIEAGPIVYHPGGAGGGGNWEITVSAGEGSNPAKLKALLEGTGLFGPHHSFIEAKPGKFFHWLSKNDRDIFSTRSMGQPAQTDWIHAGQEAAQTTIERKIRAIDTIRAGTGI